jgi:hypothetical protein
MQVSGRRTNRRPALAEVTVAHGGLIAAWRLQISHVGMRSQRKSVRSSLGETLASCRRDLTLSVDWS